ncbi:GTP 3',8-cyclase MoaA [Rhodococcus sp. 05-2256-B2]|uniref:GTP 3',8-cyclase MoaA n=1 Tax=Nocardiaceae TaxID=85025 RepID=UPI0009B7F294|nr:MULTISPECIES: GTP 3',8-cyclase MoaA [Rhodococcus]OZD80111.1 GTP 3',8-cyclase MoaA [Rhodococcus sp. 05-2256-B4]OZD94600.1 GTP 3',8-cyclase MoaA [Rhodococcus sp. 05-2256-B2]OZD94708.1 GTP 3',8-cyclase MoaA [Rhodococcus sp. 05-2256-B3]OZE08717.1 GTP 3',8-cyclase MoaA [Rhodococcus sp. 05-2256-B1]
MVDPVRAVRTHPTDLDSGTVDTRGRALRDLRISVTDRCNFRCVYCMPRAEFGPDHRFLDTGRLLSFGEIERVARAAATIGIRKIRLTGGEPLLRAGIATLIERLSAIDGVDLAMTTNGSLLAAHAASLYAAGLKRVTVSLDSIDPTTFARMSDTRVPVRTVLDGIDAAVRAGMSPVKVNVVVRRGVNGDSILDLAERFRGTGIVVRFIEYMDVGATNRWEMAQVMDFDSIVDIIGAAHPLERIESMYEGEVATRYRYRDGSGEIGVIGSVSKPFCGSCTRARLSADGQVYTCLFASAGTDLRALLRSGASQDALVARLSALWNSRDDRYSELRAGSGDTPAGERIEMSYIGG